MTSALRVLALALVIATIGTTSAAGSADHDRSRMPPHVDHRDLYKPFYPNMKSRTNTVKNSIDNDIINTNQIRSFNDMVNKDRRKIVHRNSRQYEEGALGGAKRRVKRESTEQDCEAFLYKDSKKMIMHPHDPNSINKTYYRDINCVTVITAGLGDVISLTFVDFFEIEDHPKCEYDFLEIRDGQYGYSMDAKPFGKFCGSKFPPQMTSSGPALWLKFHSDETIEYKGFHISIEIIKSGTSYMPSNTCNLTLSGPVGLIESTNISKDCLDASKDHPLDVIWTIRVREEHTIFLNFSSYSLAFPNECEENVIQVFGYILEFDSNLAHYCGSIANPVLTKGSDKDGQDNHGNVMYVRFFASKKAREKTYFFNATFTEFKIKKNPTDECSAADDLFDCGDNTCIKKKGLECNGYGNCRLKTDEDPELCKSVAESIINEPHILAILIIFCLILSGMTFVFLFKCIRKLYHDHKLIKEHISQSCEDRLDTLIDSRFTLDPKKLQRDSEPRASLERDNHTNELVKQQRKISQQRKTSSLDSDMLQETQIDFDDEPWRREVDITPLTAENKPERNGRMRRRDTSKREESIRRNKDRDSGEPQERKRDASVGAPDTKESGCQTRESLFQGEVAPSEGSANSGNSRGFSTFGYSGGTIARPSPAPAPAPQTTEITIELLRQMTPQESVKPQKKIPDRRPMSTETTRSAPDVIIVSKPIR